MNDIIIDGWFGYSCQQDRLGAKNVVLLKRLYDARRRQDWEMIRRYNAALDALHFRLEQIKQERLAA